MKPCCLSGVLMMLSITMSGCLSVSHTQKGDAATPRSGSARHAATLPTIVDRTLGMDRQDGLLTFYHDEQEGRIWLALDAPTDADGEIGRYIYFDAMRGGLGSNPVGIDRGQLGNSRVVRIRRVGPQVLIEQVNLAYRALTDDQAEREAVRESFASSILWGGRIEAMDESGGSLVDITSFLVRDAHGIAATLRQGDQGDFSLDRDRSFVEPANCLAFPDNVEFETTITFASQRPGRHVRSTTPEPTAVTLQQRHSFVRLPDGDYQPRAFDPRIASFAVSFFDYASPIDAPLQKQWISRHRLRKPGPGAADVPAGRANRVLHRSWCA